MEHKKLNEENKQSQMAVLKSHKYEQSISLECRFSNNQLNKISLNNLFISF